MFESIQEATDFLYDLGNGNKIKTTFDFSEIANDDYKRFLKNLPNFFVKKCIDISFYQQKLIDENRKNRSNENENIIAQSVFRHQDHSRISKHLIQVFMASIPRNTTLQSLRLVGFEFSDTDIKSLFDVISNSPKSVLRCIHFQNCIITDDAFCYIINLISPYKFESVSFDGCNLGKKSGSAVIKFLNYSLSNILPHKEWRLNYFNLNNNEFSKLQYEEIDKLFLKCNPNAIIEKSIIKSEDQPQFEEEETSIEFQKDFEIWTCKKPEEIQEAVNEMQQLASEVQVTPTDEKDPREANKKLKAEFNELMLKLNAQRTEFPGTYLVAPQKENIEALNSSRKSQT